jgi:hypothetical protein
MSETAKTTNRLEQLDQIGEENARWAKEKAGELEPVVNQCKKCHRLFQTNTKCDTTCRRCRYWGQCPECGTLAQLHSPKDAGVRMCGPCRRATGAVVSLILVKHPDPFGDRVPAELLERYRSSHPDLVEESELQEDPAPERGSHEELEAVIPDFDVVEEEPEPWVDPDEESREETELAANGGTAEDRSMLDYWI